MTFRLRAALVVTMLAVFSEAGAAQVPDSVWQVERRRSSDAFRTCTSALPRSGGPLTVIHLTARPAQAGDSLPRATHASIDLFVETIAVFARARLGALPGNLPYADSTQDRALATAMFSSHLHVVARRNGTVRWWGESDSTPTQVAAIDSVRRAGEQLLGAALDSALRSGEYFQWSDAYEEADSITFAVHFVYPIPDRNGKLQPIRARHAAPLIAVHVAPSEPVTPLPGATPSFPRRALERGATATLVMRFVVDTTGRVVPGSIEDVWPADKPRPRGHMGRLYEDFRRSVTTALESARFTPARFGGCAYPTQVQQAFSFDIAR